jgi:alpha-glucosidase (family GH31 glycosyl hydrolase)
LFVAAVHSRLLHLAGPSHGAVLLLLFQAGVDQVSVTLPTGAVWYEALGGAAFTAKAGTPLAIAVHMDAIPVFFRGGYIVPRK